MTFGPKWDYRFIRLAKEVAGWSKDPSTQIGVILVDDSRRVVATGYNGFPPGIEDDSRLLDREKKYRMVVHAELNALLQAGQDAKDSTLFLWAFAGPPCHDCVKHVIAAGVKTVIGAGPKPPERWTDSLTLAEEMLREAGVKLFTYEMED